MEDGKHLLDGAVKTKTVWQNDRTARLNRKWLLSQISRLSWFCGWTTKPRHRCMTTFKWDSTIDCLPLELPLIWILANTYDYSFISKEDSQRGTEREFCSPDHPCSLSSCFLPAQRQQNQGADTHTQTHTAAYVTDNIYISQQWRTQKVPCYKLLILSTSNTSKMSFKKYKEACWTNWNYHILPIKCLNMGWNLLGNRVVEERLYLFCHLINVVFSLTVSSPDVAYNVCIVHIEHMSMVKTAFYRKNFNHISYIINDQAIIDWHWYQFNNLVIICILSLHTSTEKALVLVTSQSGVTGAGQEGCTGAHNITTSLYPQSCWIMTVILILNLVRGDVTSAKGLTILCLDGNVPTACISAGLTSFYWP